MAEMLACGLLHDTDATGWRAWFDAAGASEVEVAAGPVFEDFNLLRAAALAGQGVALCPLAMIADDLRDGRLVQLSDTAIRAELRLLYRRGSAAHAGNRNLPRLAVVHVR